MKNNVRLNSAKAFYELEEARAILSDAFEAAQDEAVYKLIAQATARIRKAQNAVQLMLQDNHNTDNQV